LVLGVVSLLEALSAVGAPGQSGRPAIDTLTDFLMRRRTLVVLDNCEHLLDGCAELAGRLLAACSEVKVLATAREAVNIPGEVLWKVRPLTIPDEDCALEGLQSSEAVVLFTDRTRAVEPDFEITTQNAGAVTQICRRLDGMPLAIELAASRVRSMAVQELSSRLDDRFHLLTGGTRMALPASALSKPLSPGATTCSQRRSASSSTGSRSSREGALRTLPGASVPAVR
jgi:predicted ATPase